MHFIHLISCVRVFHVRQHKCVGVCVTELRDLMRLWARGAVSEGIT